MSDAYLGEIRMFAGIEAPRYWHFCDGSTLSIVSNQALFSILGTTYGGDGRQTFALPDLRGRVPIGWGQGAGLSPRSWGETGGTPAVTLLTNQLPMHIHTPIAQAAVGSAPTPANNVWAMTQQTGSPKASSPMYDAGPGNVQMNAAALASTGAGQAHNNMQPYLGLNYIICLNGIYPPRG